MAKSAQQQKDTREKFKALQAKLAQASQKLAQEQEKARVEPPAEPEGANAELVSEERKLADLESKHHKLLAENNALK